MSHFDIKLGRSSQPPVRPAQAAAPPVEAGGALSADALRIREGQEAASHTLGWVKTQGSRLVDAQGRSVPVRGVNLGGWLIQEPWMMPLSTHPKGAPPVEDQATMWRAVEERFGPAEAQRLRDAYRQAWLADEDFARMKEAGFTTVRLPFSYQTLQEPDGIKWLDWAIERAARHGLYTILDMHGAPGGQSDAMHTGKAGEAKFFTDPANIRQAAAMWREIARRYADRPEVLGYDLLNEPMGARSARELYDAQNELYKAVREVDKRHVVFIEDGYKGIDTFPRKERYGWENIAYSIHQYKFGSKASGDHLEALEHELAKVERVREARDVPVYVGEFNVPDAGADTLTAVVERLEKADVPWTMWTYKVAMPHAAKNVWGMFRNDKASEPLDVRHDALAELERKIGLVRTEHLQGVPGQLQMFQRVAAEREARADVRPARRGLLGRLWLQVQDRALTGWAALVDAVKSRF